MATATYLDDLKRRLQGVRSTIEHLHRLETGHAWNPGRVEKFRRERREAEADAIRLESLLAETEEREPAQ